MDALTTASPIARQLYDELLAALRPMGPFQEEVKKASIHLVRGSAFGGVHPRKGHVILTIKAAEPIQSSRICKTEQMSKNRWHLDVKVGTADDIDDELRAWLQQAYALCP